MVIEWTSLVHFHKKKPLANYTDLTIPSALPKLVNNMTFDFFKTNFEIIDQVYFYAHYLGNVLCEKGLESPVIQNLINNPPNDPPYDLVVTEVNKS